MYTHVRVSTYMNKYMQIHTYTHILKDDMEKLN